MKCPFCNLPNEQRGFNNIICSGCNSKYYTLHRFWLKRGTGKNIDNNITVYTTEDGKSYTELDIYNDINTWFTDCQFIINPTQENKEKLYKYILNIITWEHPNTILDQIDQDEYEAIFER